MSGRIVAPALQNPTLPRAKRRPGVVLPRDRLSPGGTREHPTVPPGPGTDHLPARTGSPWSRVRANQAAQDSPDQRRWVRFERLEGDAGRARRGGPPGDRCRAGDESKLDEHEHDERGSQGRAQGRRRVGRARHAGGCRHDRIDARPARDTAGSGDLRDQRRSEPRNQHERLGNRERRPRRRQVWRAGHRHVRRPRRGRRQRLCGRGSAREPDDRCARLEPPRGRQAPPRSSWSSM